ncbi:class I lanthipeptide [uncultured Aquimarina sp.]|uniref:class I lanthipeptide n=1 Tax=uncultured Aquimarina sp. TaxID=575652 RepID=UPI00262C5518|nr:class I lanthipeptide [uncultured Aquimarina sp.]
MKKEEQQKISIKKLTIARINIDSMRKIEGGTSVPTETIRVDHYGVIEEGGCYYAQ